MIAKCEHVAIKGIVTTVPQNVEDNSHYIEILGEKRVKKQTRMTGVKSRHIELSGQTVADLCIVSGRKLIEQLNWNPHDIRVLVLVTQYPTIMLPSTAFIIQKYLGLSDECLVFDVNLGCSGYVSGLHLVSTLLESMGEGAKGILLAGDTQRSELFDKEKTYDEIADEMLFGSAGSATALKVEANDNILLFEEFSDGNRYNTIYRTFVGNNKMNGEAVFEYAINDVVDYIKKFERNIKKYSLSNADYYVFHQTQRFMLQNIADICGYSDEKMLYSLEKYGNTSSGSIPLTLCLHKELFVSGDKNVFLCGFGVGLACAMASILVSSNTYLELLESNEMFPVDVED
ncbi:MAG: 3-oxoacyl-ACP synthase III family protein [Lachnospiraceae bacterium]